MTKDKRKQTTCILSEYRRDGCASCDAYCPHKISMVGLNGEGGRIASAGLPREYRNLTLSTSPAREGQPKIYEALERYVATFSGDEQVKSLYLWSESPGTGKTTTASVLLTEFIIRDYLGALREGKQPRQVSAVFFDVNEFQTEYNLATMTRDEAGLEHIGRRIKRVQHAPFAVIDDVGIRSASEAFKSYVHAIVNYRVTNGLPTVYTSNLPIEEMAKVFDARLYDRIRDQCGVIEFSGASKRGRR